MALDKRNKLILIPVFGLRWVNDFHFLALRQ